MHTDEETYTGYGEEPSKAYRVVRGCFKGVLYGASALVWILIFYVIFSTRESKLMDQMVFTDATRNFADKTREEYLVSRLYPADFMNQDGSIEVGGVYYSEGTHELEIGVKYNKKLTDGDTADGIRFVLTDQEGTEYLITQLKTDAIGRYGYARICFQGILLPLSEEDGGELRLTLFLYRNGTERPLATHISADRTEEINDAKFVIYDDSTVISSVKYDG